MHALAYHVRALIFSPDGALHLERPPQTYTTSAEARVVCNKVLAGHGQAQLSRSCRSATSSVAEWTLATITAAGPERSMSAGRHG